MERWDMGCTWADAASLTSLMLDFTRIDEVVAGLAEGTLQADLTAIADECARCHGGRFDEASRERVLPKVGELTEEVARWNGDLMAFAQQVRREHTRLFDHPDRPALPYYEGAFINRRYLLAGRDAPDESVLFINRAANDADRQYRKAGLRRDAKQNIPGDCMVTEMAFLGYLLTEALSSGEDAALREFMRLHMRPWAHDFFASLAQESDQVYFRVLAEWSVLWLETLRASFPREFWERR